MREFPKDVLDAVASEKEVLLMTYGRKTGKESSVTIWMVTDGKKVPFKSRHISDPAEARHSSKLYGPKYGDFVKPSNESDPLTPGEQAAFELLPADV